MIANSSHHLRKIKLLVDLQYLRLDIKVHLYHRERHGLFLMFAYITQPYVWLI